MAGIHLNRSRQVPAEETPAFGGIAERFRRAGDLDRAIALCRDGLKRFPNQLSARVTLGWSLLDKGQYDEARAELERVIRKAPDNLAAIRGLAELHDRSEGAMSGMDERESSRHEEPAPVASSAGVPAADATVALTADGAVDQFAPIPLKISSSAESDPPPELLHTADLAGLAAQEAAASFELGGAELSAVVDPVQLEDPAEASMAAAEEAAPFFVGSPSDMTMEIADVPEAGSDAFVVDETDETVLAFEAASIDLTDTLGFEALGESSVGSEMAFEAGPAALVEPAGFNTRGGDDQSALELADAISALEADSFSVEADLPAAVQGTEDVAEPVAEAAVLVDASLEVGASPDVSLASFEDAISELEPPGLVSNADFATDTAPMVVAEELPDVLLAESATDELAEMVGRSELPDESVEDLAAFVALEEEAAGPHFELVAPDAVVALTEEADDDLVELDEMEESAEGLMASLFANLTDEPAEEPVVPAGVLAAVDARTDMAEWAATAPEPLLPLPAALSEEPAVPVAAYVGEDDVVLSDPALLVEDLPVAEVTAEREEDAVDLRMVTAAAVEAHQAAEVVVLADRRAEVRAPVVALERFLRQVEARRLQLRAETVA